MADLYNKEGEQIEELFDSEGNPIDNLQTPEEIEQQIQDAKDEAKADYDADTTALKDEIEEGKEALKIAQEDLAKEQEKDKNFGKVRGKAEKVDELTETVKTLNEKLTGLEATTKSQPINTMIKEKAGGDIEMEKKIKFHYNSFTIPDEDTEELQKERVKNAIILAGGGENPVNPLEGGVVSSGGGVAPGGPEPGESGKLSTPEAKNVGKKMGLTDKEMKEL